MVVKNSSVFYIVAKTVQEREGWVDSIYLDIKEAVARIPYQTLLKLKENNFKGFMKKIATRFK